MEIFGFSIWSILGLIAFLVIAPFIGCILAGLDRKITAGMQGRVGPRLLQPWWDFRKLLYQIIHDQIAIIHILLH